jgi:hypothetical protein
MAEQEVDQLHPDMFIENGSVAMAVIRQTGPDGQSYVVVRIYHSTGHNVHILTPEYARTIGNALLQAATGLTLAKPADLPNHNGKDH